MFAPKFIIRTLPGLAVAAALMLTACENNPTALSVADEPPHSTQGPPSLPSFFPVQRTAMVDLAASAGLESASASLSTQASVGTMSGLPLGTAWSRGYHCSGNPNIPNSGYIRQNFPNMTSTSGAMENVYFYVVLQHRVGGAWRDYRGGDRGWYSAPADRNGIFKGMFGDFVWTINGNGVTRAPEFERLPAGYYRVIEMYQWQNGVWGWQFSRGNGTAWTECRI